MTNFKLKNYTTSISAEKSVMEIEALLANFGATAVMKQYLNEKVISLSFKLNEMGYKLPANVEGVNKILTSSLKRSHRTNIQRENDEKQAYMVTWRIIRDWLHSQLSIIASGQAQPDQVLLPYLFDGKKTLYDAYKDGTLRLNSSNAEEGK